VAIVTARSARAACPIPRFQGGPGFDLLSHEIIQGWPNEAKLSEIDRSFNSTLLARINFFGAVLTKGSEGKKQFRFGKT
jgi:hypothetical protein